METTLMDKTVGIIGLGIMGGAIARNLVELGWRVIGFDIEATKRTELPLANVELPLTSSRSRARRPSS
jgi:L-threonate 2-dehydrogenase